MQGFAAQPAERKVLKPFLSAIFQNPDGSKSRLPRVCTFACDAYPTIFTPRRSRRVRRSVLVHQLSSFLLPFLRGSRDKIEFGAAVPVVLEFFPSVREFSFEPALHCGNLVF